MRAVVVNKYGEPPVVAEVPRPQAGPGQVLIKLTSAAMNPMDRTLASGDWRPAFQKFDPVRVARFTSGEVEALLSDRGIVRNRPKLEFAVNNARRILDVQREFRRGYSTICGHDRGLTDIDLAMTRKASLRGLSLEL